MKTTRKTTTHIVSEADARERFSDLVRQVAETGEAVIVARTGEPDVTMIPGEEDRRIWNAPAGRENWRVSLRETHELIRRELAGKPPIPWEDIIREMREEPDEQLMDDLR